MFKTIDSFTGRREAQPPPLRPANSADSACSVLATSSYARMVRSQSGPSMNRSHCAMSDGRRSKPPARRSGFRRETQVPGRGFEPRTRGFTVRCSGQLSYPGVGAAVVAADAPHASGGPHESGYYSRFFTLNTAPGARGARRLPPSPPAAHNAGSGAPHPRRLGGNA